MNTRYSESVGGALQSSDALRLSNILRSRSTFQVVLESFIYGSIALAALLGNLLVLFVVYKTPRLRTAAGLLVTSLAVSDIAMASLATPPSLTVLISGRWITGFAVCQFQGFVVLTLVSASLQTMALMSVDRFFRVVRPTQHRTLFTIKRVRLMTAAVWVLAIIIVLPYNASGKRFIFQPGKFFCFYEEKVSFVSCIIYIDMFVSLVILSVCYFYVFKNLRLNRRRVENLRAPFGRDPTSKLSVEDVKLTRTLFVTVLGYLICWTPVLIIDFIDIGLGGWSLPRWVYFLYTNIGLVSSSLNPIIYGALNKTFRREYKKIICFKKILDQGPNGQMELTNTNSIDKRVL